MEEKKGLTLNQETVDVLVANIIPTTKYFESRFDYMQNQIDSIKQYQEQQFNHLKEQISDMKRYHDKQFEHLQYQIDEVKKQQYEMKEDIEKRFTLMQEDMDTRFEQVDKRFEQVDKRFEQIDERFKEVDKRFEQLNESIFQLTLKIEQFANATELRFEKLEKSQETTIRDYIIERDRYYDRKFNNLRNFNIAIISLIGGMFLKIIGIIG